MKRALKLWKIIKNHQDVILFIVWSIAVAIVVAGVASLILLATGLFVIDQYQAASTIASILLVIITGIYAVLTYSLVGVTQNSIEQTEELRQEERYREVKSLRRALRYEIEQLPVERIKNLNYRETQNTEKIAPNTIFQQNAGKIGLLSEGELEAITSYYWELSQFEEYIKAYSRREGGGNIQNRAEPLLIAKDRALTEIDDSIIEPSTDGKGVQSKLKNILLENEEG